MTFKTKLTTAIATGAVLLNALAPMSFATTLEITGNGSGSDNDVKVEAENKVEVKQNNDTHINNDIEVKSDTGNNDANGNVGGKIDVTTGNATTNITANNTAGINQASVENCCNRDATVNISGNGKNSDNNVKLDLENKTNIDQNNDTHVRNDVEAKAETGNNDANDNVGGGVSLKTGNVNSTVNLSTTANANLAEVTGGDSNKGVISAFINGNGADSDNTIKLDVENRTKIDQDNDAHVDNDVDVKAETGDNDVNHNVGGAVDVITGNADATVAVDNLVNFNAADVDACGCLADLKAKIGGNGEDSENKIKFESELKTNPDQYNKTRLSNDPEIKAETGDSDINDNVGTVTNDPSMTTGNTKTDVKVDNTAGANVFGNSLDDLLKNFDFGFDTTDLSVALKLIIAKLV